MLSSSVGASAHRGRRERGERRLNTSTNLSSGLLESARPCSQKLKSDGSGLRGIISPSSNSSNTELARCTSVWMARSSFPRQCRRRQLTLLCYSLSSLSLLLSLPRRPSSSLRQHSRNRTALPLSPSHTRQLPLLLWEEGGGGERLECGMPPSVAY